jgi:hypothetical protein
MPRKPKPQDTVAYWRHECERLKPYEDAVLAFGSIPVEYLTWLGVTAHVAYNGVRKADPRGVRATEAGGGKAASGGGGYVRPTAESRPPRHNPAAADLVDSERGTWCVVRGR